MKDPRRNIPLSLALGTAVVIGLYLLANVAYLVTLPLAAIQHAPSDRVATATLERVFPGLGAIDHGRRDHDLDLRLQQRADPRRRARLLRDGARRAVLQGGRAAERAPRCRARAWCCRASGRSLLVLPRTYDPATGTYGNLYSNLLDYVISAALIFYILTIVAVFRLRATRPDAERPYRAFGYPVVPALYILGAATILIVLFVYRPATTWPGLVIVFLGLPVY